MKTRRREFLRLVTGAVASFGGAVLPAGSFAAPATDKDLDVVPPKARRISEERFRNLPDYPFSPHYVMVEGARMHYVDEGTGPPVLMLHGEPTWSYLYRKFIPPLVAAGFRCIAPDHIGFGKSDKYAASEQYTYDAHFRNLEILLEKLDLQNTSLVCQDWGGLLGLPLVSRHPDRFSRLVCMNTLIPGLSRRPTNPSGNSGERPPSGSSWVKNSHRILTSLPEIGEFLRNSPGNGRRLSDDEVRAYSAPFPDMESRASALRFPVLVPPEPTLVSFSEAAMVLRKWEKPVFLIWGDADHVFPIETAGEALHRIFRTSNKPIRIEGGTHFVQESAPERITKEIIMFLKKDIQ